MLFKGKAFSCIDGIVTIQTTSTEKAMAPPLQYSFLENPMDGGAWWAAVHVVAKSWT